MPSPRLFAGILIATLLWAAVELVGFSDGATSIPDYLLYVFGGAGLGVATTVGALLLARKVFFQREKVSRDMSVWVAAQSLILAIVFVGVSYDMAFAARFALSRNALATAAQDIRAGHRARESGWIGLMHVHEVDVADRSVRFITGMCFLDDCGIAFNESGEPPRVGEDFYRRMYGPWWRWRRSW